MRLGILFSGLLHFFFLLLLIFGPFSWQKPSSEAPKPIPIEIINISELSVAPPPKKSQEEKPPLLKEPKPEVTPTPEPPQPQAAPIPEPTPDPIPEKNQTPEPEVTPPEAPPPPPPLPEPEAIPLPDLKPEIKPEPTPEPKKQPPLPMPPEKPALPRKEKEKKSEKEKEEKKPAQKGKKPKEKKEDDFFSNIEKALENLDDKKEERQPEKGELSNKAQANEASVIGDELSISELDALKRQLAQCWSPPSGMKEAETMVVELNVSIQPDGQVRDVKIVDLHRYQSDNQFRPAADAARRAVLNPNCNPLKIPLNKYESLKTFILKFDPREMF